MVNAKHASRNSGQAITVQNPIHEGQLEVEVHICMSVSVYLLLLIYYYIYHQPDNSVSLALHHIAAFGRSQVRASQRSSGAWALSSRGDTCSGSGLKEPRRITSAYVCNLQLFLFVCLSVSFFFLLLFLDEK